MDYLHQLILVKGIALVFWASLLCILSLSCDEIQGDFEALTRLVQNGACLSTTELNMVFQTCHIVRIFKFTYVSPILISNIITKFCRIEVFETSIIY